jgi:hypothetical protein
MKPIFLPANFNGQEHMQTWAETLPEGCKIEPEILEYIIHMIMRKCSFSEKYEDERFGYVPIHSRCLKRVSSHHYKQHIDYLEATEVIEVNQRYSSGRFSKGYRLRAKYKHGKLIAKALTNRRLLRLHNSVSPGEIERMREAKEKYPYLVRWLDGLRIDREAALTYVDQLELVCSAFYGNEVYYKLRWRFNLMRLQIERIHFGDISYMVDKKGLRFHSNLTSLKKELRNFLTYEGQPLGDIDIKNSQPYLSQLLLNKEFWEGRLIDNRPPSTKCRHRKMLREGENSPEEQYKKDEGKIAWNDVLQKESNEDSVAERSSTMRSVSKDKSRKAGNRIGSSRDITVVKDRWRRGINMSLKKAQMPAHGGFALFHQVVNEGRLYEFLIEQLPAQLASDPELNQLYQALGSPEITRDYIKKLTMVALYCHPRSSKEQSKFAQLMFAHHFPGVIAIFAAIKKGTGKSYTRLPILLQRIESMLVLDRICQQFSKRHRQPVFTIHDGLITTVPYVQKLKAIAEKVITSAIGVKPNLEKERWSPDKIEGTIGAVLDRMIKKQQPLPEEVHDCHYGEADSIVY